MDRFLNFMSMDDRESHGSKLASFNLILLLTITVHQVADDRLYSAGLILACALVGLYERYRRGATAVVFGVLLFRYGGEFPSVANHSYLELLLLSLYLWIDSSKAEEKELFLQACRWLTVIVSIDASSSFVDEQRAGPYQLWHHRHEFEEVEGGVEARDIVHYALPFDPLSRPVHDLVVRRQLESIFGYRYQVLAERFGSLDAAADGTPPPGAIVFSLV